jgi:hypothetical protein
MKDDEMVGYVAHMEEMENSHKISVKKWKGRYDLERPRCRWI